MVTASPSTRPAGRPLFFDLSQPKPRGRKKSERMQVLAKMQPGKGGAVVMDHTGYETPFPVWIAQARMREDKNFQYERVAEGKELYRVWVPKDRTEYCAHTPQVTLSNN